MKTMSGRLNDLSPKQKEALEQIRVIVKDILKPEHDDFYLLRWLRARNFDLKKTETMMRNNHAWRKKFSVDTILEEYKKFEVLEKYYVGGLCGKDNEGCLVWYEPGGFLDMQGVLRSVKKADVLRMKIHLMEGIYKQFKEQENSGKFDSSQLIVVFDLHKFGMKHLWKPGVDVFCEMISMFEDQYPETLRTSFVINAPRIFPIAYSLIRPFLSEETIKKVHILGTNYKEVLSRHIPADQLPAYYGGTLVDPDGNKMCASKIGYGGEVPERYYSNQLVNLDDFTESTIGRGSSLQLDYEIKVSNSAIRWQFKTDGFDIGFGVYRRTKSGRQKAGEMEAVMMTERVNSHLVPEDGSITCKEIGTYVIRFDNTYSWARGKKILYQIEVLEPNFEDFNMPRSPSSDSNSLNYDTASHGSS